MVRRGTWNPGLTPPPLAGAQSVTGFSSKGPFGDGGVQSGLGESKAIMTMVTTFLLVFAVPATCLRSSQTLSSVLMTTP